MQVSSCHRRCDARYFRPCNLVVNETLSTRHFFCPQNERLRVASIAGRTAGVQAALTGGANPATCFDKGMTALYHVAHAGSNEAVRGSGPAEISHSQRVWTHGCMGV